MNPNTDTIIVRGTPAPKGSYRPVNGYNHKTGSRVTRLIPMSKHEKPWRLQVSNAVHMTPHHHYTGPIKVTICFRLRRPNTVTRKYPSVKPDLDKLQRSTFDALTDSGIIEDDSLIVEVHATERYDNNEGATITIEEQA